MWVCKNFILITSHTSNFIRCCEMLQLLCSGSYWNLKSSKQLGVMWFYLSDLLCSHWTNKVLLNLNVNLIVTFTSSCGNRHFLPPCLLFVFRHLILKWFRSVVHVQLRSKRALALTKFLHAKRLKVETNFTDTLKCFIICSAIWCSNLSLLSGCFIL